MRFSNQAPSRRRSSSRVTPPYATHGPRLSTIGVCGKLKMVLMCILLVPVLRVVFVAVIIIIWSAWMRLLTCIFARTTSPAGPRALSRLERLLLWPTKIFARAIIFSCGCYWFHVNGRDRNARIVVGNHCTMLDGFLVSSLVSPVAPVAISYAFDIPLLGGIGRAQQGVAMMRDTNKGAAAGGTERHQDVGPPAWRSSDCHIPGRIYDICHDYHTVCQGCVRAWAACTTIPS